VDDWLTVRRGVAESERLPVELGDTDDDRQRDGVAVTDNDVLADTLTVGDEVSEPEYVAKEAVGDKLGELDVVALTELERVILGELLMEMVADAEGVCDVLFMLEGDPEEEAESEKETEFRGVAVPDTVGRLEALGDEEDESHFETGAVNVSVGECVDVRLAVAEIEEEPDSVKILKVDDTDGEELVVLEIVCDLVTSGEREAEGETLLDMVTDAHAEMDIDTEGDGLKVLEIVGEIDTSGEREIVGDPLVDLDRNALAEVEPQAEDEWLRVSPDDTVGLPLVDAD
jgi:hypothetical protein